MITLNRTQIESLSKIVDHFQEIDKFKIELETVEGIGEKVKVTFNLFGDESRDIGITVTSDKGEV